MSNQYLQDAVQAIMDVQTAKASPILRQYFSGHARLEAQNTLKAALPDLEMHFRQKIATELKVWRGNLEHRGGCGEWAQGVFEGIEKTIEKVEVGD